jgi:hypothetical protein
LPQVKYETGEMSVKRSSKQMDANVWLFVVAGVGGLENVAQRNVKPD